MKFKSTLAIFVIAIAAIAQPVLAEFTQNKNGEITHVNGIPLPPMQTVEEARVQAQKEIAAAKKAREAMQPENNQPTTRNASPATPPQAVFFTGKPYIEETGQYAFLFRSYDPELSRWTTADPSGFPDWPNNYLYSNAPLGGFDASGLAWGNIDFVWHFYFGSGAPVTLSEIGLLEDVKNAANSNPDGGAYRFGNQIADTAAAIAKPYNGTFSDSFSNSYDFGSIIWAMGSGTLSGTYLGNMTSTPNGNGMGGRYSYSGEGSLFYRDIFTDPLDLIQMMYGDSNAPEVPPWLINAANVGGIPFVIFGGWTQTYSGGGVYE